MVVMLKALLLIFDPVNTWDKIEKAHRSIILLVFQFLLPLLLISSAVEAYGLIRFGRENPMSHRAHPVAQEVVMRYETVQFSFSLLILLGGAWILKKTGEGFQRRHSYVECFTTVVYSLSPLFLFRMFNALPAIDTWICWGVGILFSVSALYRGVPRIMKPDPSNALGVYLTACLLFIFLTGLAQFLAMLVLDGKLLAGFWPQIG